MSDRRRELYVEGGGDHNPSLASELRRAFSKLFERAGIQRRPSVIACGGRQRAYEQFCTALPAPPGSSLVVAVTALRPRPIGSTSLPPSSRATG